MNAGGPQEPSGVFEGRISYDARGVVPPPPPLRIVTPIRVAIVLLLSVSGFLLAMHEGWFLRGRDIRQTPLVEVAPLPIDDTTTPFAGDVGTAADGYPTQYVDLAILRAMLARKRYEDLTKYFEQFQVAFENDPKHEYWIGDAARAFESAEPAIQAQLDDWVAVSPSSFAPYLARGSHWVAVGFARRGGKYVSETPIGDMRAMHDAFRWASDDLARAVTLRPTLVAAKRLQINVAAAGGTRATMDHVVAESLQICPQCFQVRATYVILSVPKWGGSFALIDDFLKDAPVAKNPRLRLLPGYAELERAHMAGARADWKTALAADERACALGDNADFLLARAANRDRLDNLSGAKADLDRAVALRPNQAEYLAARAFYDLRSNEFERAAHDLLAALRIDPTDGSARGSYADVVQGVLFLISEAHKSGNDKEALRLADLGAEIAPADTDIQRLRGWILSGSEKGTANGTAAASAMKATGAVPDDIDEVRKMDYALSRENKYGEILPLWDAYIAKHPNDGRAYLERGGTHLHLGDRDLAGQDALKACDLGVNEGCLRAHQLGL